MEGKAAAAMRSVVEPAVEALGFELVFVEVTGGHGRRIVRLYIDGQEGVGLEACAAVSRELSPILEVDDPISGSYVLEVSSPGLDRPLARPEDFSRHIGQRVRLKTARPIGGQRSFTGLLTGFVDGVALVEGDDGDAHRVPFSALKKANLEYRFDD